MAYGSDDFNYGVRVRKWRVKREDLREVLVEPHGRYLCPHCKNIVLQGKTDMTLYWDDNMNYILDRCDIGKTNTKGTLKTTTPKDNLTICTRCKYPAFSYDKVIGKKRQPYRLDDELFEI